MINVTVAIGMFVEIISIVIAIIFGAALIVLALQSRKSLSGRPQGKEVDELMAKLASAVQPAPKPGENNAPEQSATDGTQREQ